MDQALQLLDWGADGWGDEFAYGLLMTLKISAISYVISVAFGLLAAFAKLSPSLTARLLSDIYTTVVRSLPELLVILLLYFSIGSGTERLLKYFGLVSERFEVNPFWAAVIALAFVSGAFMAEVMRAAFLAVPRGQIEAALSIGMSRRRLFIRIIFPQMMRHALPGMSNLWLSITKESAIVSVLGAFSELLYTGYQAAAATREFVFFYGLTALLFLLISWVSVLIISRLEKRLGRGHE